MTMTISGLANAITSAQGTASPSPSVQASANTALATAIVNYLTANMTVTCVIPPSAIATAGNASAQVGPPAPVDITGTVS